MFDPYRKWLGIPAEEQPPNHYRLLGIGLFENDQDVVKSAVVQRSAYVRNFQAGKQADNATRILNEIGAADACLTNPAKRGPYDAELKRKISQRKAAEAARQPAPAPAPRPLLDPALEQWAAAPALPNWAHMAPRQKSWATWQVAAIGGGAVVAVLLAVVVIMQMVGGDEPQPVAAAGAAIDAGDNGADNATDAPVENAETPADAPIEEAVEPPAASVEPRTEAAAETAATSVDVPLTAAAEVAPESSAIEEPQPDPAAKETEVFLDTMRPFDVLAMDPNTGTMIREEGEGYRQLFTPAWAGTASDQHPISPIPPRPGGVTSHVAFPLAAGFRRFRGTAAISDALQAEGSRTPLVFRVVGDGRPLWKSAPLQRRGAQESFDVDVSGIETLHLLTDCEGDDYGAWAVWLATRLVPDDEAVEPTEAPSSDASGVFLTELPPQDIVATDPFTAESFATKPTTEYFDTKWAGSLPAEHAIWGAPLPNKVSSHVAFRLRRGCQRFTGRAAISDLTASGATAVTFKVIGNGRELWRSKPLKDRGATEAFDVDVSQVDKLELQVDCPGSEFGAWAVWLDPRVTPPPAGGG